MGLFLAGRNEGELIFMDSEVNGSQERIPVEGARNPQAFSFGSLDTLYLLDHESIQIYTIEFQSTVGKWTLYE